MGEENDFEGWSLVDIPYIVDDSTHSLHTGTGNWMLAQRGHEDGKEIYLGLGVCRETVEVVYD